ncbi:MAG: hypothetical protein DME26_01800, partial [Verrucomicrobia bacterium]
MAMTLGFAAALWLNGLKRRWRNRFLALAALALALPPFLVCNSWLHFLGLTGTWRVWLPFNIYSLNGTVLILSLMLWPITLMMLLGAWQRLEPAQLEAEPALAGSAFIRWLLWPLGRRALSLAAILTFVLALNNFAVPAILQVKVFPAELWVSFNTTFNYAEAMKLSCPLVIAPLVLLLAFGRRHISWPNLEEHALASVFRCRLGAGLSRWSGAIMLLISVLSVGVPLTELFTTAKMWTEFLPTLAAGTNACWHSFLFAALTATLVLIVGLVTWRWPIGLALWLPFFVPGILLGIFAIYALNRFPFTPFYQSAGVVLFAFTLRYLAIGWNAAAFAFRSVDCDLTDAGRLCGASRWQLWRHVQWPQTAPQLAAAWYVTYLFCLWDVESIVLIWPPGGETLALRVFNLLHYGHNAQVNALCLLLLMLALLPLILWATLRWLGTVRNSRARLDPRPSSSFSSSKNIREIEDEGRGRSGRWGSPHLTKRLFGILLLGVSLLLAGCGENPSRETSINKRFFSSVQVIGTRGAGTGEFNKPRSVALDTNDNLYVLDMTGRVQ